MSEYPNFSDVTNVDSIEEDSNYVYVITNPEELMLIDSVFTTLSEAKQRLYYITNEFHNSGKIIRMEVNLED